MFEQLYQYPKVLSRHLDAPFLVEREQFLQHCANQGMAHCTLTAIANELLVIMSRLDMENIQQPITSQQIEAAADRWACYQQQRGRCRELQWSRKRFVQVATNWLHFINHLAIGESEPSAGEQWIKQFTAYMQNERGLSPHTIYDSRWHTEKFFRQLSSQNRTLSEVTIADVDAFLESLAQQGWCRVSLAKSAKILRAFFLYAEHSCWCTPGIAAGIVRPRVFRDEGLPVGPDWIDVKRLISSVDSNTTCDVRDKAILQLLAIYGLRSGEVRQLLLEDLNWTQDRISITRSKQQRNQEFPLLPSVGESILRYLQQARPQSAYREVFLTLRAPIRPLSTGGVYNLVNKRLRALDIRSTRHGSHALRHACAARLVAQGFSLKEIGDHLGHSSVDSTHTYYV